MVARNPVAAKRATSYADRLRVPIAVIHGEVKEEEMAEVDVVDGMGFFFWLSWELGIVSMVN